MIARKFKKPNQMMSLGMFCLALSTAGGYLLHRFGWVSENVADFIKGLFLGMALALLIWAMNMKRSAPNA